MDHYRPNFFSGSYLDWCAGAREQRDWLSSARADPGTRYLLGRGSTQLLHLEGEPAIAFLTHDSPLVRRAAEAQLLLLGWFRGERVVLIDLPPDDNVELPPGRFMGELGFVAPKNRRTQTVKCIEDGDVLTITYEKLLELYFQNPEFGYYFLRLTSERLMQNISRLEALLEATKASPR